MEKFILECRERIRVQPLGVSMPGTQLPRRMQKIVEGGAAMRITRLRVAATIVACALICAAFAAGTLVHASVQSSEAAHPATNQGASTLAFDAASLKPRDRNSEHARIIGMQTFPDRLLSLCTSLTGLVYYAYDLTWVRPEGLPDWAMKACADGSPEYTYDFQATMPTGTTVAQSRQMMQAFLAERFKLVVHWEKKDESVYALVVAPGGFKLKPTDHLDGPPPVSKFDCPPEDPTCHRTLMVSPGAEQLVRMLAYTIGRPVLDKTGLTGQYIFDVRWSGDTTAASPLPSLPAALRESFGLELKSEIAKADILVIDHVEMPTPN